MIIFCGQMDLMENICTPQGASSNPFTDFLRIDIDSRLRCSIFHINLKSIKIKSVLLYKDICSFNMYRSLKSIYAKNCDVNGGDSNLCPTDYKFSPLNPLDHEE